MNGEASFVCPVEKMKRVAWMLISNGWLAE
jgi:hypothetical protein